MTRYIVNRLVSMVITLVLVTIVVVLLVHAVPGNIVDQMLGQVGAGSVTAKKTLENFFGLNRPVYIQYVDWVSQLFHGSLGTSWNQGSPVAALVINAFSVTAELAVLALAFAVIIGSLLGLTAARFRNGLVDTIVQGFNVLGLSLPAFWVGAMALVAASNLFGWGPPLQYRGPFSSLSSNIEIMFLPVISLGLFNAAAMSQFVRDLVENVEQEDFVRTAVAKGVPANRVFFGHILRNVLIPLTSFAGVIFVGILGGIVAIEAVFNLPGIGRLLLFGINTRDYPVVQGGVFFLAIVVMVVNLIVDLLYGLIDPRISYT